MKKLLIAMMLMAATTQAQVTVRVNGNVVNMNDTISCGNSAYIETMVQPYVTAQTYKYKKQSGYLYGWGFVNLPTYFNPQKLRLDFYWNGGKSWFICWIKK